MYLVNLYLDTRGLTFSKPSQSSQDSYFHHGSLLYVPVNVWKALTFYPSGMHALAHLSLSFSPSSPSPPSSPHYGEFES